MNPGKSIHIYTLSQVRSLLDSSDSAYDESDNDPTITISMCSKSEINSSEDPEGMVECMCTHWSVLTK